jgi:carboxymethylenebutenolidase
MAGTEISISAGGGDSFMAYLAKPNSGRGPGIIVIQEIFGVNAVMRDIADGLADDGYFALCPDLFWRQEPGIQLTDRTDKEWARAFELYQGFDVAAGVRDIAATIAALRQQKGCTGKVGAVGYCLGGRLAYLTAVRTDCDASVGYYGVAIEQNLAEAINIEKPLLLHIAEADEFVPKAAQTKIVAALKDNKLVTLHRYPGMNHAFARVGGKHYDKANAELANRRTREFFKTNLS